MKNTAIYIRVSTEEQAKEGDSIPAQREALLKYVREDEELSLFGEYVDEGISGQKFEQRDELQRMLADVRAGKIDLILFVKLDRFFRSIRHYSATQELLDKHHVDWKAIWEPMYDTTTPSGRLICNQMMSIAQFEAENTGQRIRNVFSYKISRGEVVSGKVPKGYAIENKHLVPGAEADVIRELFKRFSRHGSVADAVRYYYERTGNIMDPARFRAMIKNTKYIGVFRGNDHYCEPLVEKALFDDCNRKLGMNVKQSQKYTYIFSGLMVCAECGKRMTGIVNRIEYKTKTDIRASYRCVNHFKNGVRTCSNQKVLLERTMESYLLENVSNLVEEYKIEYKTRSAPNKDATQQRATLEKRLGRLKELYLSELIDIEEYKADREKLLIQISNLGQLESTEPKDLSGLDKLSSASFKTIYEQLDNAERRSLWRSVIKEIRFDSNRQINVVFL